MLFCVCLCLYECKRKAMVLIRFLFWQCFNKNSLCCFWCWGLNTWLTGPCTRFPSHPSSINPSILLLWSVCYFFANWNQFRIFVSSDKSLKYPAINFWKGYKVDRKKTKVLSCSSQNKLSVIFVLVFRVVWKQGFCY